MQVRNYLDARGLELVLQQRKRVVDDAIQIHVVELGARRAREVQQAVDDLGGAESLPRDLVQQFGFLGIATYLFCQHLGIRRDYGEWRIDLVGHTRRQQSDGGELFRLGELRFQLDAFGDVVHDDQAADHAEVLADQRRDGDVGDAGVARGGTQTKLVEIVDSRTLPYPVILLDKCRWKDVAQRTAQHFGAGRSVHHFHLRVPGLDAVFQIDSQHTYADGLDDVLVELLEALVLRSLALQRFVKARILQRDANVAGQGFEQLHIFTGEEIAFRGFAQPEHGDHAVHHGAGNVVVEVEPANGFTRLGSLAHRLAGVVEEQVALFPLRALHVQEVEVESAGVGDAERLGESELLRMLRIRQEHGHAVHQQRVREAINDRSEHVVEVGFGIQIAAKLDQRLTVVVAFLVKKLVEVVLNPVLEGVKEQCSDGNRDHQADRTGAGEVLVEEFRDHADGRKICRQNCASGNGVSHAALEDEVDVHQAVAEYGVAEREGQEHQRQNGEAHAHCRHAAEQVGNHVKNGERSDGEDGTARYPLHLLPQDGRACMTVAMPEHDGRGHKVGGEIDHRQPIKAETQGLAGLQPLDGNDLEGQDHRARQIHQGNEPAAACQQYLAFGEGQRKVQEQRRLQKPGHDVRPVNDPVEVVELASVVKRIKNERHQAENVEMSALGCSPAAQQDVQPNPEINQRNQAQTEVQGAIGRGENQGRFDRDALAHQGIGGLRPDAGAV